MSKRRSTPPPWTVTSATDPSNSEHFIYRINGGEIPPEEVLCNRALIANAPVLLEALKAAQGLILFENYCDATSPLAQVMEKVIAQATGGGDK